MARASLNERRTGGPPFANTRPSGKVTCFSSAPGSPLRSGATMIVISSPGLIMLNFQPMRLRMPGFAPSIVQS